MVEDRKTTNLPAVREWGTQRLSLIVGDINDPKCLIFHSVKPRKLRGGSMSPEGRAALNQAAAKSIVWGQELRCVKEGLCKTEDAQSARPAWKCESSIFNYFWSKHRPKGEHVKCRFENPQFSSNWLEIWRGFSDQVTEFKHQLFLRLSAKISTQAKFYLFLFLIDDLIFFFSQQKNVLEIWNDWFWFTNSLSLRVILSLIVLLRIWKPWAHRHWGSYLLVISVSKCFVDSPFPLFNG